MKKFAPLLVIPALLIAGCGHSKAKVDPVAQDKQWVALEHTIFPIDKRTPSQIIVTGREQCNGDAQKIGVAMLEDGGMDPATADGLYYGALSIYCPEKLKNLK